MRSPKNPSQIETTDLPNSSARAKYGLASLFLILASLEGIPAIALLFRIRSEPSSSLIFGYSPLRIILALCALALELGLVIATAKWLRSRTLAEELLERLDSALLKGHRLQRAAIALATMVLAAIAILMLFFSPIGVRFGPMRFLFERSFSLLCWIALIAAQGLLYVLFAYRKHWIQPDFLDGSEAWRQILISGLIVGVAFHWFMLITQDAVLSSLPYSWIKIRPQGFSGRDLLFLAATPLILALAYRVTKKPQRLLPNLLLILITIYGAQVMFGAIEGGGFRSLRQKLLSTGQRRFIEAALSDLSLAESVLEYEEHYGTGQRLATRPPGSLAFYVLIRDAIRLMNPDISRDELSTRLTMTAAVSFPILAEGTLLVLLPLSRRLLDNNRQFLPLMLLMTAPSFLLIQLQLDQFLYPAFFAAGILLLHQAINRRSYVWGFAAGMFSYVAAYLSFSLLPILGLGVAWIMISFLAPIEGHGRRRILMIGLSYLAGWIFADLIFRTFLNYDFFLRYSRAMAHHRQGKLYEPGLRQIMEAALVNSIEFLFWAGIPLALLSLSRIMRSMKNAIARSATDLDYLSMAFALMVIALFIGGQTRGEVGRLWIFLLPVLSLLTADEMDKMLPKAKGTIAIVAIQWFTAYWIFKYAYFF